MASVPPIDDPVRALAIAYTPRPLRPALSALFALDERLAAIHAATRDPAIGLVRLAWWRDALAALDRAPPPGEPLLRAIAGTLQPAVTGAELAAIAEGWGVLLEGPLDAGALDAHARDRGARLFLIAARLLGDGRFAELSRSGELWALVDLHARLDAAGGEAAMASARARIGRGRGVRWPGALRPLGMLAALAAAEARGTRGGAIRGMLLMLLHRASGRTGLGGPLAPS